MRKICLAVAGVVMCLGLGLAVVGCSQSPTKGKDKMEADKMGTMEGDKMKAGKMDGEMNGKMKGKMDGDNDKMNKDKM